MLINSLPEEKTFTVEKISYRDLNELETMFADAFSDEVDIDRIRARIRRIRQFYFLLQPLSYLSRWIQNLFYIYIARLDGDVVGFVQLSRINDTQLHLDYTSIAECYRGQGVGTKLLRFILIELADHNNWDIILEVNCDNPAFALYQRLGFQEQTIIYYFEKELFAQECTEQHPSALPTIRGRYSTDWQQIYQLYKEITPPQLQIAYRRSVSDFRPSFLTSILERSKDLLMRNKKIQLVIDTGDRIAGTLDLTVYPGDSAHINIMLHPEYESYRKILMSKALLLASQYKVQVVATVMYGESPVKQQIFNNLGFQCTASYYLMHRTPLSY